MKTFDICGVKMTYLYASKLGDFSLTIRVDFTTEIFLFCIQVERNKIKGLKMHIQNTQNENTNTVNHFLR